MTLIGFLPEPGPAHHLVADDRGVVDQDVEPALLGPDPVEQRLRLLVVGVVDLDGDALAARRGHQLGGFADRARRAATGPAFSVRPVTYTVHPWLPSACAMPSPAPRLAPVTTATVLSAVTNRALSTRSDAGARCPAWCRRRGRGRPPSSRRRRRTPGS